jgi:hypothetical protein
LNRAAEQRVQGRSIGQRGCVVLRDIGISEYHAAVATDTAVEALDTLQLSYMELRNIGFPTCDSISWHTLHRLLNFFQFGLKGSLISRCVKM